LNQLLFRFVLLRKDGDAAEQQSKQDERSFHSQSSYDFSSPEVRENAEDYSWRIAKGELGLYDPRIMSQR